MLQIIKYQLKGRKNALLLTLGVLFAVNLLAWFFGARELVMRTYSMSASMGFWIFISMAVTFVSGAAMFFMCASGHASGMLYRDSGYLMLTVPRHGWEILGGRFLAGLIEGTVYGLAVFLSMCVHFALWSSLKSMGELSFLSLFTFLLHHVFILNPLALLEGTMILLCVFASAGSFLTFALVASRSFVKNRTLATVISVAVFIMLSNWSSRYGTMLSEKLGWYLHVPFSFRYSPGSSAALSGFELGVSARELTIPIAPFAFYLVVAALLFAAASWLMEKKVEL